MSYLLTGSEDNHLAIRQSLCTYLAAAAPDSTVQKYHGAEPLVAYLDRLKMRKPGVGWGTDVEIFAAAQLMKCDIFVLSDPSGNGTLSWQKFSYQDPAKIVERKEARRAAREAGIPYEAPPHVFSEALYLDHAKGNHYDAVIGFK